MVESQENVLAHKSSAPDTVNQQPRPLQILCLNYEFPPMGGGAGNATRQTAIELQKMGHTVHVLTSRLPGQAKIQHSGPISIFRVFSTRRSIHECGWIGVISYIVSGFFKQIRLARIHKYDIYHYYFGLPTGLLALYTHWILKKPYIISLRGSDVPGYDRTRRYLQPLHFLLRPLLCYVWRNAAYVIGLSQNLRALAHEVSPTTDIGVISNGIDSTLFPRKDSIVRIGPVRLICVCRLVQRKGLKFLIEAMRELRNDGVTLEIVGAGESEKEVRDLIDGYDLNENILLTGYVPRSRIATRYQEADIFLLPSISESFGQVLLEAMSCGLPIVASRAGGIPETVEHGTGGLLVEPGSSRDIVNAVRLLAHDPVLREKMAHYNAERAREQYSWTAVALEYASLYQNAVSAERPSAGVDLGTE